MLTHRMFVTLSKFLDMNSALYHERQAYCVSPNLEKWKSMRNACVCAISSLDSFTDDAGVVIVNESNIEKLSTCVEAIQICMNAQTSWHRAYLVWIVYRFLAYFEWRGDKPMMETCDSWGPLIYELSQEQLSYYLWWRQEANLRNFHEATGEYVWLFIYEKLLNSNCNESCEETLTILESLYAYYRVYYLRPIHKRLTVEKFGHLIVNYALFNGLYDYVEELGDKYGIEDDYPLYQRMSKGNFRGLGRYLINFASADIKTKSFNGSDEESYALQILPEVIEGIYKRNNVLRSLLINDICGKCHQHVCWDFYETPVFAPNIARFISHGEQASFSLNGNTYHLATGETLSSDKELINNQYSWYYNDHGDRFHIAGLYYRKQFSGITTEGKQLIDFVLREIQIYYRTTHKMRTLKAKACPYVEYADEVNTTIQQCLEAHESYEIVQHEEEDVQRVKEFVILKEEELKVPSKFKFMRERQSDQRVVLTGHNDDNSIEFLEIPDDIEEIGAMAFAGCTNLKAVVGGFGLKQIGVGAFLDCSNLQTVVLQDGTKQIDDGAFSGCIQLEEILIPMSVHRIGNYGGPCVFEGNPTILCGKYSAAYNYAVEHNLKYKITETNW